MANLEPLELTKLTSEKLNGYIEQANEFNKYIQDTWDNDRRNELLEKTETLISKSKRKTDNQLSGDFASAFSLQNYYARLKDISEPLTPKDIIDLIHARLPQLTQVEIINILYLEFQYKAKFDIDRLVEILLNLPNDEDSEEEYYDDEGEDDEYEDEEYYYGNEGKDDEYEDEEYDDDDHIRRLIKRYLHIFGNIRINRNSTEFSLRRDVTPSA